MRMRTTQRAKLKLHAADGNMHKSTASVGLLFLLRYVFLPVRVDVVCVVCVVLSGQSASTLNPIPIDANVHCTFRADTNTTPTVCLETRCCRWWPTSAR